MSSDSGSPADRYVALFALAVAIGGAVVSFLARDGGRVATVADGAVTGGLIVLIAAGTVTLYRSYRRSVDVASEPRHAAAETSTAGGGHEPVRIFGLREGTVKLSPAWVMLAVAPFRVSTDPVPWFAFPVAGAVGLYLTHRLFEGPLAVP